jgi:hypothetical protein
LKDIDQPTTTPIVPLDGGTKIDALQNTITLRADLHKNWEAYEIGINPYVRPVCPTLFVWSMRDRDEHSLLLFSRPKDGYRVTAFIAIGDESIDGRQLRLDHIDAADRRPLDDLLRDHFLQGMLAHIKGGVSDPAVYAAEDRGAATTPAYKDGSPGVVERPLRTGSRLKR